MGLVDGDSSASRRAEQLGYPLGVPPPVETSEAALSEARSLLKNNRAFFLDCPPAEKQTYPGIGKMSTRRHLAMSHTRASAYDSRLLALRRSRTSRMIGYAKRGEFRSESRNRQL